jgi:hypothetical protein
MTILLSDLLVGLNYYFNPARHSFTEFCDLFKLSINTGTNSKLAPLKVRLGQNFKYLGSIKH